MMFVDTSVLVAASIPSDLRHEACITRLALVEQRDGACAAHTLAELFATLTRLPVPYRLPASDALRIVQHTSERFTVVDLTSAEYLATLHRFVELKLTGAMVYDALILASARKCHATRIYTLNRKHFRTAAPDLASRIVEP